MILVETLTSIIVQANVARTHYTSPYLYALYADKAVHFFSLLTKWLYRFQREKKVNSNDPQVHGGGVRNVITCKIV